MAFFPNTTSPNITAGDFTRKNPFSRSRTVERPSPDFPEGFIIEEFNADDTVNKTPAATLVFKGNMMPHVPFTFGGGQRLEKIYYPGQDEPVIQALGAQEDNITLKGDFKAIRFKVRDDQVDEAGLAYQMMKALDEMRRRGNLCRFTLGEWVRWGFLEMTRFDLKRKTRIMYELGLTIIGENKPTNNKFVTEPRQVPFAQLERLNTQIQNAQGNLNLITLPDQTLLDAINTGVSNAIGSVNELVGYVDRAFAVVENIQRSINRALGLVRATQRRVKTLTTQLQGVDPSRLDIPLSQQYLTSLNISTSLASLGGVYALLAVIKEQFLALRATIPLTIHRVRDGETLQSIAVRYYLDASPWREIAEFNNLPVGAPLVIGQELEIPRLEA